MKRLHRFWHRLMLSLLLPLLAAALLLALWLRPPALLNPGLPPAWENAAVETPAPSAAPTGKTR